MVNQFPDDGMFIKQPADERYSKWVGHVGLDWRSMGFAGYHPTAHFAMSVASNDIAFCWADAQHSGYGFGCGLQDLFCSAWNIVFEELLGAQEAAAARLNCSAFSAQRPLGQRQRRA